MIYSIFRINAVLIFSNAVLGDNKTLQTPTDWEQEVITHILKNYDRNALPRETFQSTANVTFDLSLHQLISLDERHKILTTNIWYRLSWFDPRLRWKPTDFGNVSNIRVFIQRIWEPDIALYNDVSRIYKNMGEYFLASVSSSGRVHFEIPQVTRSYCKVDMAWFPFDQQHCDLVYSSWSHDTSKLRLDHAYDDGETRYLQPNSGWKVLRMPVVKHLESYSRLGGSEFEQLKYTIELQRIPQYFMFNLVLPGICISVLALLVFCLPPDSGGKVAVSITALLATVVLMRSVADQIPHAATAPLLSRYFGAVMILMTISTCLTCLVCKMNWFGVNGVKVPKVLRKLLLNYLARALFMRQIVQALKEVKEAQAAEQEKTSPSVSIEALSPELSTPEHTNVSRLRNGVAQRNGGDRKQLDVRLSVDAQRLSQIGHSLTVGAAARGQLATNPSSNGNQFDWIVCAMVFERLLFVILSLIILIVSLVFLAR